MIYISPENEYPRYYGDIMQAVPGWELGDDLPEGWVEVQDVPYPVPTEGYTVEEGFPIEVNGVMTRNFIVREFTEEEKAYNEAPESARARLKALGFTDFEITALSIGKV